MMMFKDDNILKVALVQTHLLWENPRANRRYIEDKIKRFSDDADLIILPEMFTSGFTMNPVSVSETMNGDTVKWMKDIAEKYRCAITGSLVITENDAFYNRMLFVQPGGSMKYYDKRHTFTLAGEHNSYHKGDQKVIIDYKGWKLCLQICYDLRFPVWSRNTEDYDALIYVANWPVPRIEAWDTLLKARAIENMCYTLGVNRVGIDGYGFCYNGHSGVYDYLGKQLTYSEKEGILHAALNKGTMLETRGKLQFLNDRDRFTLM